MQFHDPAGAAGVNLKDYAAVGAASACIPLFFKRGCRDRLFSPEVFIAAESRSHRISNLKHMYQK